MNTTTRRDHLKMLFGMAAMSGTPLAALAQSAAKPAEPVPPQGIGKGITHLSYSDQGGRPDGVQVMVNRKHVYVGHMFSDGLTILDATDPRKLKPVGFFTAGPVRARTSCKRRRTCCCSPMARTSSRCSPTTACAAISRTSWSTASPTGRNSAPACRFTIFPSPRRCGKLPFSKCPASASIGSGGPADGTPTCRRISTATPITSSPSSI